MTIIISSSVNARCRGRPRRVRTVLRPFISGSSVEIEYYSPPPAARRERHKAAGIQIDGHHTPALTVRRLRIVHAPAHDVVVCSILAVRTHRPDIRIVALT